MTASQSVVSRYCLPLHDFHVAEGARMEPFAGWSMPLHYPDGILKEHLHTRTAAGLFDVSHMGQILVRSRSGDPLDAARALEALLPIDVMGLKPGRQRYGLLTTDTGGIRDDLMVANLEEFFYLVVNAASVAADFKYLQQHLSATCDVEYRADRALLAVQGPAASAVLGELIPTAAAMRFMDAAIVTVEGAVCFISRSGYTGEDGFEISIPKARVLDVAVHLSRYPAAKWIGLGARDSLRLEAGLCLYGHDIDLDTTPIEAALEWAIQPVRRADGSRAGGFPGAEVILGQSARGAARRRVGLRSNGRPVREGAVLFADEPAQQAVGRVTSGAYGPSVQCPVAMGYVPAELAQPGTRLYADVRGQRIPVAVSPMPFFAHRYHR